MLILLMGAPGSGKGHQGQFLMEHFGISRISSGDMLRDRVRRQDDFGKALQETLSAGKLVEDDVMIAMIRERLAEDDCQKGCILDGFPRTVAQAIALEVGGLRPTHVICLDVPPEVILERITGRWVHPASGRVYHEKFSPPLNNGLDDKTNEPLVQREDDQADRVQGRLEIYYQQTQPVIDFYASADEIKYAKIDGNRDPQLVRDDLLSLLEV